MTQKEVTKTARELLAIHNLNDWNIVFDRAKRRNGQCNYSRKVISLSKNYIRLNEDSKIINTIKHEIAHALTPHHHHDNVWKLKCIEIGCLPNRCSENVVAVKPKYVYECPKCDNVWATYKKKKPGTACGDCCKKYNNGKFTEKFIIKLK